jgi:hypothetical protein
VGDLHLEPGQHAELAASATEPGWDIQIIDGDGGVADAIQLKATESVSYVHRALERYPDTPILTTHEVASKLIDHGTIYDSGIDNGTLTDSVNDTLSDASADAVSDGLIGAMPLSLIAATEAFHVWSGKKTVDEAMSSGGDRLAKGAVAGAVAAAVSVVATPLVGAVAGFVTRLMLNEETKTRPGPKLDQPYPDIVHMRGTASRFDGLVATFERHYPSSARHRLRFESKISDQEELAQLVGPELRLTVLRGAMPLDRWIRATALKDTSEMAAHEVDAHLGDLEQIRSGGLIDDVFPAEGFFEKFAKGFSSDYRDLLRTLDEAIQIAKLHKKRLGGTFTVQDAEHLAMLKLSPAEREVFKREKKRAETIASYDTRLRQLSS